MPETVLFVDDSTYWTDSIAHALRAEGYVVSIVHDGLSAVERLRRDPPNILITDYFLENLDGGKLCQIAKGIEGAPIRTIILTGGADRNLSRVPSKFADAVIAKNSTDIVLEDLRRTLSELRNPTTPPPGEVVGHSRLEPRAVARKLHGLKQYLDALHEGIGDAVVGVDADLRVYFINSMTAELFDLKEEDALAKPLHEVLRIAAEHAVIGLVRTALSNRSKPQRPVTVEIAGSTLRVTVAGLKSPNGRSTALLIARDISDLKAAELQRKMLDSRLHEADKMASLGHLVAGISHEVNNPLAAIILNLGGFKAELTDVVQAWELHRNAGPSGSEPDRISGHLSEMRHILDESFAAAERIRAIVAEMRLFAHPGSNAGDRMQVSELLDAAMALISSEVRYKARIIREYGTTPDIVVDQARLGQAFLNIVLNAAQAIEGNDPDSHWIRITTRCGDDGIFVEVSNSGPPISPDAIGKIFDPFFTTKPVGKGVGLGLSVAYETLRRHGGYVEAISDEATPTTFRLWLPLDTGLALQSIRARRPEERVSGTILLVDDDKLVRNSLRRILEKDHEIVLASSGSRALELLKDRSFDVVLCDLIMPGMTGMELFDRVRIANPEQAARFVFLTGGTSSAEARDFLQSVENPRAYKPLSAEEIVDLVHRALKTLAERR